MLSGERSQVGVGPSRLPEALHKCGSFVGGLRSGGSDADFGGIFFGGFELAHFQPDL